MVPEPRRFCFESCPSDQTRLFELSSKGHFEHRPAKYSPEVQAFWLEAGATGSSPSIPNVMEVSTLTNDQQPCKKNNIHHIIIFQLLVALFLADDFLRDRLHWLNNFGPFDSSTYFDLEFSHGLVSSLPPFERVTERLIVPLALDEGQVFGI